MFTIVLLCYKIRLKILLKQETISTFLIGHFKSDLFESLKYLLVDKNDGQQS